MDTTHSSTYSACTLQRPLRRWRSDLQKAARSRGRLKMPAWGTTPSPDLASSPARILTCLLLLSRSTPEASFIVGQTPLKDSAPLRTLTSCVLQTSQWHYEPWHYEPLKQRTKKSSQRGRQGSPGVWYVSVFVCEWVWKPISNIM